MQRFKFVPLEKAGESRVFGNLIEFSDFLNFDLRAGSKRSNQSAKRYLDSVRRRIQRFSERGIFSFTCSIIDRSLATQAAGIMLTDDSRLRILQRRGS